MKLHYPQNGWAEVSWREEENLGHVAQHLLALSALPGVELTDECIRVPRSAWATAHWHQLFDAVDYAAPHPRALRSSAPHWAPVRPLYKHQTAAVDFLVEHGGGLCADQMGLGKTSVAIVAAETMALTAPERHRLIIAPGYTRDVWRRELLTVGAITHEEQFWYAEGQTPTKKPVDWDATWFFVSFAIAHYWTTFLTQGRFGFPIVAIIDELHNTKNGRTQRGKATQALAGCAPHRIGLTGTPLPNRVGELWWPLTILDGPRSWGSPIEFRTRYSGATHNGRGYEDHGQTRVDELQERLQNRYIRRTVESAEVELPSLTRQLIHVQLTEKDTDRYTSMLKSTGKDNIVRAILERRAGRDTLAAITRMRKLTSKAKLDTTVQYVTDALDAGDSVVVFVWQRETVAAVVRAVAKKTVSEAVLWGTHGGIAQAARDSIVQLFQRDGGVLVATIDALKEGVTLTKARHVVLHDLTWVPSDILQAEARVHRIGQDKPVMSNWVVADDTIDMLFAATLTQKAGAMARALGITAAEDAAAELGLDKFAGTSSVEDEIDRLLEAWVR